MIKQILLAPDNLYAVYDEGDGSLYHEKVLYIALMEDGTTELHGVSVDGFIDNVLEASNFDRIEYK